MKKVISLILIVATLFTFAGCSSKKKYKDGDKELKTFIDCTREYVDGLSTKPSKTTTMQPAANSWTYSYQLEDDISLELTFLSDVCRSLTLSTTSYSNIPVSEYTVCGIHVGDSRITAVSAGIENFTPHHTSSTSGSTEVIQFEDDDGGKLSIFLYNGVVSDIVYHPY